MSASGGAGTNSKKANGFRSLQRKGGGGQDGRYGDGVVAGCAKLQDAGALGAVPQAGSAFQSPR